MKSGEQQGDGYWNRVASQKRQIFNVRAEALRERSWGERILARVARTIADRRFFFAELLFHAVWIALNLNLTERVPAWDPYPFSLLTGLASLQALLIALLLLMHSQSELRIDQVREETDLQVALHAERETTRLLQMVTELHERLGIKTRVPHEELEEMRQPLDPSQLRQVTAQQIDEIEEDAL